MSPVPVLYLIRKRGDAVEIAKICAMLAIGLVTQTGCRKVSEGSKLRLSLAEAQTMSGTYAKQLILANKSSAAGLNLTTKTERLQLVKMVRTGEGLEVKATTCSVRSVSSNGSELSFPQAFVKNIPLLTYGYSLESEGSSTKVKSGKLLEVFGARLSDPAVEALPKSKNDPRVFDQDLDGHPGMSVNLKVGIGPFKAAGQVYIVQRIVWRETSSSATSDTITGSLDASLDQETLGSDSSILGAVRAKVEALPSQSSFALKKIPEEATCDTIIGDAKRLFGELKL
jgi:hypothetical protein